MTKLVVLLDVDGVIANFRKLFVDCCNEANGTEFTTENTGDDWSYTKSLGLSREDSARTWEHICHHGRANDMELLPGALFGVETLIKTGHAVYFVTSPRSIVIHVVLRPPTMALTALRRGSR